MVLLTHLNAEVIDVVRQLILSDELLQEYMTIFDQEITRSLDLETSEEASVKSAITHVNKLPTGHEDGYFLGLDFSSPTIILTIVKLEYPNSTITRKMYDIPLKYRQGKSEKLFDFIAKCIVDFMSEIKLKLRRIPLGVTFGFPMEQSSLQECKLLKWSKDFKCDDLIDKSIFQRLKESIRKFPELKKIYVIGFISTSVSAALSCEWQEPNCMIGAVIGSGTTCAYVEKVYRVKKYDAENYGVRDMYINLDSGCLGDDGVLEKLITNYDIDFDEMSPQPGTQLNEKLISIDSFGELVRLIMLNCIDLGILLDGKMPEPMKDKNAINIEQLKRMESDPDDDHTNCREVLKELGFTSVTDEDCFHVQFICRCVSRRSANLVAAQLATLINRINLPNVTIAVDGDLVRHYPNYKWYLTKKIGQLKREECEFNLIDAEEKGLGEAVLAAVFGEEVMDRAEKLRRLPGFPMTKCHFGKDGKCLNPDCNEERTGGCLDNLSMKPMPAEGKDLTLTCNKENEDGKQNATEGIDKKKEKCRECKGYDKL